MEVMKKYVQHLNYLRKQNGISYDTFIEDVCSGRQWRRYLSGENIIPADRLTGLIRKLGMTQSEFEVSYYRGIIGNTKTLLSLEKELIANNWEKAEHIIDKLKKETLDEEEKKHLEFYIILHDYWRKKVPEHQSVDQFSKLINYPFKKKKNVYTYLEVNCVKYIAEIETRYKRYEALDLLMEILLGKDNLYLSSDNRYILPTIYHTATIAFWKKGDIETSLKICQSGIQYSIDITDNRSLAPLYYIESYLFDVLNRKEEAFESAKKCIATCISRGENRLVEHYNNLILKEQGYQIDIIRK